MENQNKRTKLQFFSDTNLKSKEDILEAINDYIADTDKEIKEGKEPINQKAKLEVMKRFYSLIESHDFPHVEKWWNYECVITDFKVSILLCHCQEISYKPYAEMLDVDELAQSASYPLVEMKLEFISIEAFASRSGVSPEEALQWLYAGKLYTAKKVDGAWFVSELQEVPQPVFESGHYGLKDELDSRVTKSYPFLLHCHSFFAMQNREKNIEIHLYNDFEIETVIMQEKEFCSFMFSLVQYECIESNCSAEVLDRKKTVHEKRWTTIESDIQNNTNEGLYYGYVIVNRGEFKGRIGYYDDDDEKDDCIVYFGDPLLTNSFYIIKRNCISNTFSSNQLRKRTEELSRQLFNTEGASEYEYNLLLEYYLCREIMNERYIDAMYKHPNEAGYKVFISYARNDFSFAKDLMIDLTECGYDVFLSELSSDIGDNIIADISSFLGQAIAFVALISEDYNKSIFCRDEWTSFYISFAKTKPKSIYPIILDNAGPPDLLSAIKYIRYNQSNYDYIFNHLQKAIKKKILTKETSNRY